MKTNLFLGLALLSMAPNAVSAQENADSLYIRNSVYMLKLDMPADNEEYAHAYEVTNKAFDGIDFATRYPNYNDFNLGSHHIDWSTVPTATKAEMDAIEKESAKDALLKTTLASMGVKVAQSQNASTQHACSTTSMQTSSAISSWLNGTFRRELTIRTWLLLTWEPFMSMVRWA